MSRTISNTVDYFPHIAKQGKTIFILKSRFGNDGYAFWFQLLEILCQEEGHYYDCSSAPQWQYLLSFCSSNEITGTGILNILASLGNIDPELWERKVIWCENLVQNIADVYKKRGRQPPPKPIIADSNGITDTKIGITDTGIIPPQKSEKLDSSLTLYPPPKSKVNKSKVNNIISPNKQTKKLKPIKQKYGEFLNVLLTTQEYEKLVKRFEKQDAEAKIENLSRGKKAHGYKYKSDYAAIIQWANKDDRDGKKQFGNNGNDELKERALKGVTIINGSEAVEGV